ncbi:hypothetical protein NN561_019352 [Cricetulus griseus]
MALLRLTIPNFRLASARQHYRLPVCHRGSRGNRVGNFAFKFQRLTPLGFRTPDFCLASGRQRNPVPVKSGLVQKQLPVPSDCCSVPAFQSSGRLQHAHTTDFRLRTSGSAPTNERLPEERLLLTRTRLVSPGIPNFPLASDASTIDFRSDLRDRTSSATATGLPVPQRLRVHRRESRVRNARLPTSGALPNPSGGEAGGTGPGNLS